MALLAGYWEEEHGKEEIRERERGKGRRRKGAVASRCSPGPPRGRRKQEVAMVLARDSHAAAPWDSTKNTKQHLQKSP
jgi:hypothetical protein